jgi:hypothetical protein
MGVCLYFVVCEYTASPSASRSSFAVTEKGVGHASAIPSGASLGAAAARAAETLAPVEGAAPLLAVSGRGRGRCRHRVGRGQHSIRDA